MMPPAQSDSALIRDCHNIMRMNVFQQKTDHTRPSNMRAKKADVTLEARKLFVSIGAQLLVMRGYLLATEIVQVIHGGVQSYGARNVRGAGFEPVRRMFPGALLETHVEDHFAATLKRWHRFKDFLPSVQNSNAGRPAHFVPRQRQEITADLLHVEVAMAGALGRIDERRNSKLSSAGAQFNDGIDGSQGI